MLLRPGLRGGLKAFSKGFLSSHQVGLHDEASLSTRLLVQRVVPWLRTRDFSAADDKGDEFRKKLDELREIKRQMEELDKDSAADDKGDKFRKKRDEAYFTVEYTLEMAKKVFKDSDEDEPNDKPENLDPSPESSDSSVSESLGSYIDDLPCNDYDY